MNSGTGTGFLGGKIVDRHVLFTDMAINIDTLPNSIYAINESDICNESVHDNSLSEEENESVHENSGISEEEICNKSHDQVIEKNVSLAVGESFESFEELKLKVKQYEEKHFVQFWIRDSRTVDSAQKRLTKKLNEKIKYYEVVFCCVHGGKKFKSKGEGRRSCL